jgi:aspartate aminotransferase
MQSHCTSNPNSIAQKAALEALTGPQDVVKEMREEFNKRRVYMYERMSKFDLLEVIEPKGAFYMFVDMSEVLKKSYKGQVIASTPNLAKLLLDDYAVAIVPCVDFGFPENIRLSYAISMEGIKKGLDRIEEFLGELS